MRGRDGGGGGEGGGGACGFQYTCCPLVEKQQHLRFLLPKAAWNLVGQQASVLSGADASLRYAAGTIINGC